MKRYIIAFVFCFVSLVCSAQVGTIKGFVYDKSNGEPVLFANVLLENTVLGASTDDNGYFVINKVKAGDYTLKVQCLGFRDTSFNISVRSSQQINLKIELRPMAQQLEAVEVLGNKEAARIESQVSVKKNHCFRHI